MYIEIVVVSYNRLMTLECVTTRVCKAELAQKTLVNLIKEMELIEYHPVFVQKSLAEKPNPEFNKTTVSKIQRDLVTIVFYYQENGQKMALSRVVKVGKEESIISETLKELGSKFESFKISEWFGTLRIEKLLQQHWSAQMMINIYSCEGEQVSTGATIELTMFDKYPEQGLIVGTNKQQRAVYVARSNGVFKPGDRLNFGWLFYQFGRPYLVPLEAPGYSKPEHALVVLKTPFGLKGTNHHMLMDGARPNILAEGISGGHMGMGKHLIVLLPVGRTLRASVTGIWKGPKSFLYEFDGKELFCSVYKKS